MHCAWTDQEGWRQRQQSACTKKPPFNEIQNCFAGMDTSKRNHLLEVIESTIPATKPPHSYQNTARVVLDKFCNFIDNGTVVKTEKFTAYTQNLIDIGRDGSSREYIDPQELNEALKHGCYLIPAFDEIAEQIRGAKYFLYWIRRMASIKAKCIKSTRELCTISSPFGCYRFTRHPFWNWITIQNYMPTMQYSARFRTL